MILSVFITTNEKVIKYINSGKNFLPKELIENNNEQVAIKVVNPMGNIEETLDAVFKDENFIEFSGVILFTENDIHPLFIEKLGTIFMVAKISDEIAKKENEKKLSQLLENNVTPIIKKFFWLQNTAFSIYSEILRIPKRNFDHDELSNAFCLIENIADEPQDKIEKTLSVIKNNIRKPQRRSNSQKRHYIDKRNHAFSLGPENHARHETAKHKGHNIFCDIAAHFRFGIRIDERKHFNVTSADKKPPMIQGVFNGCHGEVIAKSKVSHINMFCNDYIT